MKKLLLLTILSSSLVFSSSISLDSIGLNIGTSNLSLSKKDNPAGSMPVWNEPDDSFSSFELFATLKPILQVCKENNMKPYLSYTYSSNDDLKHKYILAGVNKYFTYKKSSLYAGALLGYGQIDWKYDPLNTSKDINSESNSFIAGFQTGIDYPVSPKVSLGLNAKFLLHDYETDLNPSSGISSNIEHDNTASISFGIRYSF